MGSAPAMVNYNLSGDALIHCLKLSGSRLVLVDEDAECRIRIEDVRDRIENELGMKIVILNADTRRSIGAIPAKRPEDRYRESMTGTFPMCLIYTRYLKTLYIGAWRWLTQNQWYYRYAKGVSIPGPTSVAHYTLPIRISWTSNRCER